jgi:SAM-dependent methyltransferase
MYVDVTDLMAFYADRLGAAARRVIGNRLRGHWPSVAGDRLLGIGYANPYLGPFLDEAERVLSFMPAPQGVAIWPSDQANATALVLDDALPLPDACIDRVLAVHSLELAENAADLLREIWRILTPGGRLVAVVPNRRGIWAQVESTPFGQGHPFSRSQLTTLLDETGFAARSWSDALSLPPISHRLWLRSGVTWERLGARLWPRFSGVIIVEANKAVPKAIPARPRRSLAPAFRPAIAPAATARCRT